MISPTQLSIKLIKDKGYEHEIVEKFVSYGKIKFRKDFKGFGDILCWKPGEKDAAIQTTTIAHKGAHIQKVLAEPVKTNLTKWLEVDHHEFIFHFWRKLKDGKKRKVWVVDEMPFTLEDLERG
jgi:hypothetical protein